MNVLVGAIIVVSIFHYSYIIPSYIYIYIYMPSIVPKADGSGYAGSLEDRGETSALATYGVTPGTLCNKTHVTCVVCVPGPFRRLQGFSGPTFQGVRSHISTYP